MSSKSGQPVINVVQVWGNRVGVGIFIEYFVLFVASQLAQCPDERVHAIWRLRDRGHVIAHLVFESSEGADMVNTVLLIERCNGFGAGFQQLVSIFSVQMEQETMKQCLRADLA